MNYLKEQQQQQLEEKQRHKNLIFRTPIFVATLPHSVNNFHPYTYTPSLQGDLIDTPGH